MQEMPRVNHSIFKFLENQHIFKIAFFCLIEYISVSINATDAYYTSNDWKLSQLFAEPSQFELRGLHEELEALKQFSFFPPRPYKKEIALGPI